MRRNCVDCRCYCRAESKACQEGKGGGSICEKAKQKKRRKEEKKIHKGQDLWRAAGCWSGRKAALLWEAVARADGWFLPEATTHTHAHARACTHTHRTDGEMQHQWLQVGGRAIENVYATNSAFCLFSFISIGHRVAPRRGDTDGAKENTAVRHHICGVCWC